MPNEAEGSVLTGNPEAVEGSWTAGLEDYQDVIDAKGWQSNADVLKSYVNLERQVGADKVVLPGEGTDLTEWEGWKSLGTPENADDYKLAAPEGFDGYSAELSDWFRNAAHEMKLPQQSRRACMIGLLKTLWKRLKIKLCSQSSSRKSGQQN